MKRRRPPGNGFPGWAEAEGIPREHKLTRSQEAARQPMDTRGQKDRPFARAAEGPVPPKEAVAWPTAGCGTRKQTPGRRRKDGPKGRKEIQWQKPRTGRQVPGARMARAWRQTGTETAKEQTGRDAGKHTDANRTTRRNGNGESSKAKPRNRQDATRSEPNGAGSPSPKAQNSFNRKRQFLSA